MSSIPSKSSLFLANVVYWIHLFYVIVSIFGVFFIPDKYLPAALLIVPLTFLDWNDFDGQCIFTRLEAHLRGTWNPREATEHGGPEFFRPILNRLIGVDISRKTASKINYVLFIIGWIALYYRFLQTYNINLF